MIERFLDLDTPEERDERAEMHVHRQGLMNLVLQRVALLDERCFSCRFFKLESRNGKGRCRLNPPQAMTRTTRDSWGNTELNSVWEQPPQKENEFCGQHQFRKQPK